MLYNTVIDCPKNVHIDPYVLSGLIQVVLGVASNDVSFQNISVSTQRIEFLLQLCNNSIQLGNGSLLIDRDLVLNRLSALPELERGHCFFNVERMGRGSDEKCCF